MDRSRKLYEMDWEASIQENNFVDESALTTKSVKAHKYASPWKIYISKRFQETQFVGFVVWAMGVKFPQETFATLEEAKLGCLNFYKKEISTYKRSSEREALSEILKEFEEK